MKPLSRRSVTTGLAAAVAVVPVAGLCSSGAGTVPEIIEEHRAAFERLSVVLDDRDSIQLAFSKELERDPVLVPLNVMPDGNTTASGHYDLRIGEGRIRQHIREHSKRLREIHCSKWSRAMVPDFAPVMAAAIKAGEKRALKALKEAIARAAARKEKAGLTHAEELVEHLSQAELKARAYGSSWHPRPVLKRPR